MALSDTDARLGTSIPAPPLPEGWRYADDSDWDDPYAPARKRRIALLALLAAIIVGIAIGLVVLNAAMHYSRGVAALRDRSYAKAATELSAAKLLVFPYRNAQSLVDQARHDLVAQVAAEQTARARVDAVTAAFDEAGAKLELGDAPAVLAALQPLPATDMQTALKGSAAARRTSRVLTQDLTTAARGALRQLQWDRADAFAAALLVLDPASQEAASLTAKAATGKELSARLAKAKDAARRGKWRTALRLALAVTTVRDGFPGAATVIADARKALAPKPKRSPAPAAAAVAVTPPPAATGGSTTGSSSGTSSQPPPP
jgi:hypothetical protein